MRRGVCVGCQQPVVTSADRSDLPEGYLRGYLIESKARAAIVCVGCIGVCLNEAKRQGKLAA